jgi:hypothetical protein
MAVRRVLLDEMPVVGAGAFLEEVGEGGAGVALCFVSVLMILGEGGVVGEYWLVGGLEGEEAHESANGKVA